MQKCGLAVAQTRAAKFKTRFGKSSGGCLPLCELQENLLNHVMGIYTAHCLDFILCVCHTSSPDRIHLVLFPDSFSVVWQPPSPAWITHRTRVERTVSFVYVSECVSDVIEVTQEVSCSLMDSPCQKENLLHRCDS